MGAALSDLAKRLFDAPSFPVLSTVNPDGAPQSSVVWIKRDGDDVLFSTTRGRRKTENLERDPRASIVAVDRENPYLYTEIRGTVSLTERGGRELIDELSMKYLGKPYDMDGPGAVRVVCRLTPVKVVGR
jgi:PPOX class probable F420-dependent enzyme